MAQAGAGLTADDAQGMRTKIRLRQQENAQLARQVDRADRDRQRGNSTRMVANELAAGWIEEEQKQATEVKALQEQLQRLKAAVGVADPPELVEEERQCRAGQARLQELLREKDEVAALLSASRRASVMVDEEVEQVADWLEAVQRIGRRVPPVAGVMLQLGAASCVAGPVRLALVGLARRVSGCVHALEEARVARVRMIGELGSLEAAALTLAEEGSVLDDSERELAGRLEAVQAQLAVAEAGVPSRWEASEEVTHLEGDVSGMRARYAALDVSVGELRRTELPDHEVAVGKRRQLTGALEEKIQRARDEILNTVLAGDNMLRLNEQLTATCRDRVEVAERARALEGELGLLQKELERKKEVLLEVVLARQGVPSGLGRGLATHGSLVTQATAMNRQLGQQRQACQRDLGEAETERDQLRRELGGGGRGDT